MTARTVGVFCQRCRAVHEHYLGRRAIVCALCGQTRRVSPELVAVADVLVGRAVPVTVVEVAWCGWCRATVPQPHHCIYAATGESHPPQPGGHGQAGPG